MSKDFLVSFMSECINSGKSSPIEMCVEAEDRIKLIDNQLQKIEILREEKKELRSVIKQLGGEENKIKKTIDFSVPKEKLDDYIINLCDKICDFVDEKNDGVTPRDIMSSIASFEEQSQVYSAIKWLLERDIISRNDNRKIIRGPKWSDQFKNE